MYQTLEKTSLAMTRKLDDMIELPKSQPKRTYMEDLECETVMVKMLRCMSWLGSTNAYDEPIGSLEVKETLGTPMHEELLNQMKLEDVSLTDHDISLSSREVPSFDELKPQLQPLTSFPALDENLRDKRGPKPPIKPHSSDSFRMKVIFDKEKHRSS
ncbi:hypothetical protein Tco_0936785 [Tanacetum coccineum]|uniref:Uncharacterized protein n=1 Tax=Tanacetum coccineum TaxID=301880 RepID=A0ABQ5DCD3_9ASTR